MQSLLAPSSAQSPIGLQFLCSALARAFLPYREDAHREKEGREGGRTRLLSIPDKAQGDNASRNGTVP